MLVDPVVEDMRILGNINMFFAERNGRRQRAARGATAAGARATAPARKRTARRAASRPTGASPTSSSRPERRGEIGRLATSVFRDRYGGIKGLRSPDFPLLNRLLGGESPTHGELLSYLFFDREFIEELIRMGQRDARRWLRAEPGGNPGRSSRSTRSCGRSRGAKRRARKRLLGPDP